MGTFWNNPPKNLSSEKWFLVVTSFETTNSVFNINNENKSFSFSIPGRWRIHYWLSESIINKLKVFSKLRSQNDIELHVEEEKNQGNQFLIEGKV